MAIAALKFAATSTLGAVVSWLGSQASRLKSRQSPQKSDATAHQMGYKIHAWAEPPYCQTGGFPYGRHAGSSGRSVSALLLRVLIPPGSSDVWPWVDVSQGHFWALGPNRGGEARYGRLKLGELPSDSDDRCLAAIQVRGHRREIRGALLGRTRNFRLRELSRISAHISIFEIREMASQI